MIALNLSEVPFSCYGSYLVISRFWDDQDGDLYLRSIHSKERFKAMFRLRLVRDGLRLPVRERATPWLLALECPEKNAGCEICFENPKTLRIRLHGCSLELAMLKPEAYQLAYPVGESRWEINAASHKLMLSALEGGFTADAPWNTIQCDRICFVLGNDGQGGEFSLEEYGADCPQHRNTGLQFDRCVQGMRASFELFSEKLPAVTAEYEEAGRKAAYLLWSAVVEPLGYLKRPAVLMSKNWMNYVWSWDHCFNALALAEKNPDLAFDQLMTPFDHQDENGALPDCVGDADKIRGFVKPPIHGLTIQIMMEQSRVFTDERLRILYEPLKKWTRWWFRFRDFDKDGIPQYNHGNDSGWDNSTVFLHTPVVETPELSAFLVIQLETLAEISDKLGLGEGPGFREEAEALLHRLLAHFRQGDRLRAVESGTHHSVPGDSLLHYLPLVLGNRLPQPVRDRMIADLKEEGRFLTPYGLATESLKSPFYQADGYWLGPIWAPPTFLLLVGLWNCGEHGLCRKLAASFCRLCAENGMAENFNAVNGAGLRDRAYSWTASVFLLLADQKWGDVQ